SCRQWAFSQGGAGPNDPVASSAVGGATLGTLLGGALGAAIGAAAGNPAMGAAVGAGSGLVLGTASGANAGAYAGMSMQQRYDAAYTQCMYAKGNQIPTAARWAPRRTGYAAPPPPPPPPPPANAPAPAPPSATAPAPPPPPPGPPPPPPPPPSGDKGPSASLAPSTAGSTYGKYASPAAFGRRLAAGPLLLALARFLRQTPRAIRRAH